MEPPDSPEVSVVIAAYKAEQTIVRAVQSALDQVNVKVEVLVVDDHSPDETANGVDRLDDPRVRLLKLTENGGPAAARNMGLAAAQAPWIAILDADDAFKPDRLRRCIDLAIQNSADAIVDNLEVVSAGHLPYVMFSNAFFGKPARLTLAEFIVGNSNFLGGNSLGYLKPLFKSAFLRENGLRYDERLRIGEDYQLLVEALASGAVCMKDGTPGYVYTIGANSISHRLSAIDVERMLDSDRRFLSSYALDESGRVSQNLRTKKLLRARAFLEIVDALKARQFGHGLLLILANPLAAIQLWMPVKNRLERLLKIAPRSPHRNRH